MALRVAWFKGYINHCYTTVLFLSACADFDIVAMSQRKEMIKRIKEIREKGMEASTKEQNLLTVLRISQRDGGTWFPLQMVDVDEIWKQNNFVIEGDSSLHRLEAIQGLGLNVANKIVEARQEQPFPIEEGFSNTW